MGKELQHQHSCDVHYKRICDKHKKRDLWCCAHLSGISPSEPLREPPLCPPTGSLPYSPGCPGKAEKEVPSGQQTQLQNPSANSALPWVDSLMDQIHSNRRSALHRKGGTSLVSEPHSLSCKLKMVSRMPVLILGLMSYRVQLLRLRETSVLLTQWEEKQMVYLSLGL